MDYLVRIAEYGGMERRATVLFVGLGLAWGIPYLLTKVAIGGMSPELLVLLRTSLAALILLPFAAAKGVLRPVLRHPWALLAYALCEIAVPWLLIGHAEERIPSSTTGLLIAATPLVGVALAFATGRHERLGTT